MIQYLNEINGIEKSMLQGFFNGWPNPPSSDRHLELLRGSAEVVLAIDSETQKVVGFITAISDGVLSAYIPLLEVLPEYQGKGVGTELVKRLLDRLGHLYMVDLACDTELAEFYRPFGFSSGHAMLRRNYDAQSGVAT